MKRILSIGAGASFLSHLLDLLLKVSIIMVRNHLRESDLLSGGLGDKSGTPVFRSNKNLRDFLNCTQSALKCAVAVQ